MLCVLCMILLWGYPLLLPIRVKREFLYLNISVVAFKTVLGLTESHLHHLPHHRQHCSCVHTHKIYSSSPSSETSSLSITESRSWKPSSLLIETRSLKQNVISFFVRSSPKRLRAAVSTRPHRHQLSSVAADMACNPSTLRANVCQCWVALHFVALAESLSH